MSLYPYQTQFTSRFDQEINSFLQDMNARSNELTPYWSGQNELLDFGREAVTNDSTRFGIALDVSSFHPSELRVALDGRDMVIKGGHREDHYKQGAHQTQAAAFERRFRIPSDVDPSLLKPALDNRGILVIDAPKARVPQQEQPRDLPVEFTEEQRRQSLQE